MLEPIATGHWIRPRPGISLWHVLVGLVVVFLIAAAVSAFVHDLLFMPVAVGLSLAALGFFKTRMSRHHRTVIADIETAHGITVPEQALTNLLYDRVTVFTTNGRRYRVEPSHTPGPDNGWEQATIVLYPMGADAATLFGHR